MSVVASAKRAIPSLGGNPSYTFRILNTTKSNRKNLFFGGHIRSVFHIWIFWIKQYKDKMLCYLNLKWFAGGIWHLANVKTKHKQTLTSEVGPGPLPVQLDQLHGDGTEQLHRLV